MCKSNGFRPKASLDSQMILYSSFFFFFVQYMEKMSGGGDRASQPSQEDTETLKTQILPPPDLPVLAIVV